MFSKKPKDDPYSNPDMLKKGDIVYPDNVESKTKLSGRMRVVALLITFPLCFLLGIVLFGRLGYEQNDYIEPPLVVETKAYIEGVQAIRELSNDEVTTAEGTFTEWIAGSPENDEIPWFRDVAYHAGTSAVYLTAASEDGLYVVADNDGRYTTMTFLDLSLRVNGSIEQVIPYDDSHLLLLADGGEQFILYNIVTDRVLSSWPARHQPDDPERYFDIDDSGVVVMDRYIYALQTVSQGESYKDEIQQFSNTGDFIETLELPTNYVEFLTITPNNTLIIHNSDELWEYGQSWRNVELLPAFAYANTAEFHPNDSLYTVGGSDAWLAERLPNGEVGIAYPATDDVSEMTSWSLGETGDPIAMTILPDGSFLIIDGYINNFQRIFRLELP